MRGQQVIIESERSTQALLVDLRDRVDSGFFWLQFSSKDFAGSVEDDGTFDVRVIHRWSRGGGAYTPHLRGRILPGAKTSRIESRLDYGEWDNNMRWLPLLPALFFLMIALVSNSGLTLALWIGAAAILMAFALPPLIYAIYDEDESQLCFLLERVAEAQREPMAAETG